MRALLGAVFVLGALWSCAELVYVHRTGASSYGSILGIPPMVVAVAFWRRAAEYDERSRS
jgi:hypothetical protein